MTLVDSILVGLSIYVALWAVWWFLRRWPKKARRPVPDDSIQEAAGAWGKDEWSWDGPALPAGIHESDLIPTDLAPREDLPVVTINERPNQKLKAELKEAGQRIHELERTVGSLATRFRTCVGQDPESLQVVNGIGPGYERQLREVGIDSVSRLASLDEGDCERLAQVDPKLARRMRSGQWIEKARALVEGQAAAVS